MRDFINGKINDVEVRRLRRFVDDRGWLSEVYRTDEAKEEFTPAMGYVSMTRPGVTRGPHEHVDQADWFCFVGPSDFRIVLWDNREDSPTYNHRMALVVGESEPAVVIVPKGVVHGYRNVGHRDGLVLNLPNRLYMGEGKRDPIDEIRHEADPASPFQMDF